MRRDDEPQLLYQWGRNDDPGTVKDTTAVAFPKFRALKYPNRLDVVLERSVFETGTCRVTWLPLNDIGTVEALRSLVCTLLVPTRLQEFLTRLQ